MKQFEYKRLDRKDITDKQFKEVVEAESEDGYTEEQLRAMWIEDPKDDNFVCIHDNRIVAHITYNPLSKRRNGSLYMVNLSVRPEYRRKGIAIELINTACEYYISQGQTLKMSTSVDKDNLPALRLYQKVGFEIKEPICEVDIDDEQYIMEADLNRIKSIIKQINQESVK